jgi:prevent-host-death family protein
MRNCEIIFAQALIDKRPESDYSSHINLAREATIMKTAAVSELKASLSAYLAIVKAGEEVLVSDRGKPVAKIIPLKPGDVETPAHLLALEQAGLVSIGENRLPKDFWRRPRPKDKKGLALKTLLKEREEAP